MNTPSTTPPPADPEHEQPFGAATSAPGTTSEVPPTPVAAPGPGIQRLEEQLRSSRILNLVLVVISVVLGVALYLSATGATSGERGNDAAAPDAQSAEAGAPSGGESAPNADASSAAPDASDADSGDATYVRRKQGDPMAIGSIDAPVVLSEWTDLRCPFCALFANQTLPTLIQEYVDTGQVRIEFHDVEFFGDQSRQAAVAARAAGEQGLYVEYLETLYAAAPESGHPDLPRETLLAFARETGVPDLDAFTAALDDATLGDQVDASTSAAQALGINSVPFFVIDGKALAGAQSIDAFREFIDQELPGAGQ